MVDKNNNNDPVTAQPQSSASSSSSSSSSSLSQPMIQPASLPSTTSNARPTATMSMLDKMQKHPYITAGCGVALIAHLGVLLSLPHAVRGRGAPFLPTSNTHSTAMFDQLRQHLNKSSLKAKAEAGQLVFCDLGSGDGRLVFRAAREGVFQKSIGYEINPVLHTMAQTRRLLQAPKYWHPTDFAWGDIWKVDLRQVDVVAVYGLTPIMKPLGVKLKEELAPGSIVLSNVFSIPGWKAESTSRHGTHIYVVPPASMPSSSSEETKTTTVSVR